MDFCRFQNVFNGINDNVCHRLHIFLIGPFLELCRFSIRVVFFLFCDAFYITHIIVYSRIHVFVASTFLGPLCRFRVHVFVTHPFGGSPESSVGVVLYPFHNVFDVTHDVVRYRVHVFAADNFDKVMEHVVVSQNVHVLGRVRTLPHRVVHGEPGAVLIFSRDDLAAGGVQSGFRVAPGTGAHVPQTQQRHTPVAVAVFDPVNDSVFQVFHTRV
mmetsp:Transcript_311/g.634  ORF Transcript_311/g.634 Transcript_311/m.634 type:complete len:214 (+) Transcript_311:832-1473(+)